MTKQEIELAAEFLRAKYVPENETKFDVFKVVEDLGGSWRFVDNGYDEGPDMVITSFGSFQFNVFRDTNPCQQRFTAARAIANVVLHRKSGKVQEFTRGDGSREGLESVWFAAALLMPENLFRQKWEEIGYTGGMVQEFGVTEGSVLSRREVLHLRDEERRTE